MNDDERTLLYRALDEELSSEEALKLRRLVRKSPEARAEFDALRDMRTFIARHGSASFGPDFPSQVMKRIHALEQRSDRARQPERTSARHRWIVPWQRIGWALAAIVVLISIGLGIARWPNTVQVPHGETDVVTLPDGSTAELSAGSELRYTPFWASSTRHVTLDGEAFFEVADDQKPFIVETFNARVVVHGTQFNVRAWEGDPAPETAVTLASGRVDLIPSAPAADSLTLTPGETSSVRGDTTHATPPTSVSVDQALSWRTGGLVFVNQPLGSALRALERRFDIRIELDDADLADRPLTYLNPEPESAASVLSDVCHVLDLRYRRTAEGYVVQRE